MKRRYCPVVLRSLLGVSSSSRSGKGLNSINFSSTLQANLTKNISNGMLCSENFHHHHGRNIGLDYIKTAFKAFSKSETVNSEPKTASSEKQIQHESSTSTTIIDSEFSKDKEYKKLESMEKKRRFENIINYYVLNCKKKPLANPDRDFALYKFFLNAFSMIRQAHSALDCLNELKEKTHKPIPSSYCDIVIHSLLSSGREEEATALLKEMENTMNLVIEGPDKTTYTRFFEYYSKEGKLYPALSLLESVHKQYSIDKATKQTMKYQPVPPDFPMFKAALKLLTEQGKMKLASNCLYLMTKHYKIDVNAPIYELFLNGYCKMGDIHSAKGYFESIKSLQKAGHASLNTLRLTYITFIKALCESGDLNSAEEVLKEFHERKFQEDPALIGAFIEGHAKTGNIQAALDIYHQSREAGLHIFPSSFASLIRSFCKMGNFEMANRILEEAFTTFKGTRGDEPLSYCSNFLLRGYLDAGKLVEASHLFEKMKSSGQKITSHTYNSLINGFCKANNQQRAIEIVGEMKNSHVQPDIYSIAPIIQSFLQSNNLENAQMFLDFATKKFNIKTNFHICCMFVQYGTVQRNAEIVNQYYQKGIEYAKKNSSENSLYFYNQVLNYHAIFGNVELCEKVLLDMANMYTHPNTISYLYTSTAFALQSKFLESRKYLQKVPGITVDENSKEALSLPELKFIFLKLIETKSFSLANTLLYDCLLPNGIVDLDILHTGMKLNLEVVDRVQKLYDSCIKYSIEPVRETEDLLLKSKRMAESESITEVSDFVKVVRY